MKTFNFPRDNDKSCPVCGRRDDSLARLVPIAGTADGNNIEDIIAHIHCVGDSEEAMYIPQMNLITISTK